MSGRGWRSQIGDALRRLRLLRLANRVNLWRHVAVGAAANRRFRRDHPGFALPPGRLAFEAYGHVDAQEYLASGRAHAKVFVDLISNHFAPPAANVLEWGCGSGRIVRQLKAVGLPANVTVSAVDVDQTAITWCRAHLAGIDFRVCGSAPPLPFAAASFDAAYHYSVWTHLSAASIEASVIEFARVLRQDGILIGTSHGDAYTDMLMPAEVAAYRRGEAVQRAGFREGRKYFLGFHPPGFLRSMLERSFRTVLHVPNTGDPEFPQDLWIAARPGAR